MFLPHLQCFVVLDCLLACSLTKNVKELAHDALFSSCICKKKEIVFCKLVLLNCSERRILSKARYAELSFQARTVRPILV